MLQTFFFVDQCMHERNACDIKYTDYIWKHKKGHNEGSRDKNRKP